MLHDRHQNFQKFCYLIIIIIKVINLYLLSNYIYLSSQVSEPITASAVDLGSCCAARGVSAECADICHAPQLQYSALVARPQVI